MFSPSSGGGWDGDGGRLTTMPWSNDQAADSPALWRRSLAVRDVCLCPRRVEVVAESAVNNHALVKLTTRLLTSARRSLGARDRVCACDPGRGVDGEVTLAVDMRSVLWSNDGVPYSDISVTVWFLFFGVGGGSGGMPTTGHTLSLP